jgi:hypothetical protein
MQRAVVLAVVAGVIAAESLVVAAGLPRYGCAEGFLLFDSREPGLSDEVVCVPDSGISVTAGEVSDRGAIKITAALLGVIFGAVAVAVAVVAFAHRLQ